MVKKVINEFKATDGQSEVPDPEGKDAHANRGADKSEGETAAPQFPTKVEALNAAIQAMSGMPKEKIEDIFKGMTAGHDKSKALATRRVGGTAKDNAEGESLEDTKRSPTSTVSVSKEDMDVIFDGSELTEEVRERTKTIFEAAVNAKVGLEVARLEEQFNNQLIETVEERIVALTENVDKYLSYAVEQWASENEVAIENALKSEIVEDFIKGLKNLFEENYVEIPEDKVDLVSELSNRIADLEDKVNSALQENVELKDLVSELEVENVFAEAVESLPLTQQEKLRSLVEGIEYADTKDFTKKLNVIKETYFPSEKKSVSLTEEVSDEGDDTDTEVKASGPMAHYVTAISKTTRK